ETLCCHLIGHPICHPHVSPGNHGEDQACKHPAEADPSRHLKRAKPVDGPVHCVRISYPSVERCFVVPQKRAPLNYGITRSRHTTQRNTVETGGGSGGGKWAGRRAQGESNWSIQRR